MSTTLQTNELTLRTSIIQKINLIFNDTSAKKWVEPASQ